MEIPALVGSGKYHCGFLSGGNRAHTRHGTLGSVAIGRYRAEPAGICFKVRELAESSLSSIVDNLDLGTRQDTDSLIAAATEKGVAKLGGMFEGLISGGLAIFNLLSLLVISPVIAFFCCGTGI